MYKQICFLLTVVLLLTITVMQAQAPQGFNYQAVIRDGSGNIAANTNVSLRFTVKTGSASGTSQYQETKALTTNQFGLVNHAVGTGTVVSGTFAGITWGSGSKFLLVEVSISGGSYTSVGTQQLMSVPYAISSGDWIKTGNNISNANSGSVGIGITSPTEDLAVRNPNQPTNMSVSTDANHYLNFYSGSTGDQHSAIVTDNGQAIRFGSWTDLPSHSGWVERMVITESGNVGIGTAAPSADLHLMSLGGNTDFLMQPTTGSGWNLAAATDGAFYLASVNWAAGTFNDRLKITPEGYTLLCKVPDNSSGNVGVGSNGYNNTKLDVTSNQDFGIYIDDPNAPQNALYVNGTASINGNLSKGGGSFKIDHPLDPANKYLYHSFVESPDMMNIYNGNITTDYNGLATVELPDYFEALNRDFRYQLTSIGVFAQAIVLEKVSGNKFTIKTDKPNVEVSWQLTGVRQDAFANQNRIPNSVDKVGKEKGLYLHPTAFGLPEEEFTMKNAQRNSENTHHK